MIDRRPLLRAIYDAVLVPHLRPAPKGRVICLACGKAAAAMAAVAERYYLDTLNLAPERLVGIATTRQGHGVPTRCIRVVEAGHPLPDEVGLMGAAETLELVRQADPDDLLLVRSVRVCRGLVCGGKIAMMGCCCGYASRCSSAHRNHMTHKRDER